ncbi:hypothetical protein QT386_23070, partial [Solimonas sp. SE-A11]
GEQIQSTKDQLTHRFELDSQPLQVGHFSLRTLGQLSLRANTQSFLARYGSLLSSRTSALNLV